MIASEKQVVNALKAAEGVLFALPRSAQSERRREVLAQVRAALAALGSEASRGTKGSVQAGSGDSEPRADYIPRDTDAKPSDAMPSPGHADWREEAEWWKATCIYWHEQADKHLEHINALAAPAVPHDETLREALARIAEQQPKTIEEIGARCLYEDYIKAIEDGSWPET
jgi:hypothetical protein